MCKTSVEDGHSTEKSFEHCGRFQERLQGGVSEGWCSRKVLMFACYSHGFYVFVWHMLGNFRIPYCMIVCIVAYLRKNKKRVTNAFTLGSANTAAPIQKTRQDPLFAFYDIVCVFLQTDRTNQSMLDECVYSRVANTAAAFHKHCRCV